MTMDRAEIVSAGHLISHIDRAAYGDILYEGIGEVGSSRTYILESWFRIYTSGAAFWVDEEDWVVHWKHFPEIEIAPTNRSKFEQAKDSLLDLGYDLVGNRVGMEGK